MIVIGLGSGRSGTASLAKLLNSQHDALCFHEMNPSCVRFEGTPRPILNTIEEYKTIVAGGDPGMLTVDLSRAVAAEAYDRLRTMPQVRLLGDIAFYYLSYVDRIHAAHPDVRFLCLKRDRAATVNSWLTKSSLPRWRSKHIADRLGSMITREPFHEARNFWMDHDGSKWALDPVWDKCFPKFPGPTRREAIEQYWDYYYTEAARLAERLADVFRIVPTNHLDDRDRQRDLLSFCGVPLDDHVYTDAHIHKSQ